jgi:hypothetical protein
MIIDRMMRIMAKSIDRKRDRKPLRQKGCSLAAARRSMSVENLKMARAGDCESESSLRLCDFAELSLAHWSAF